MLYLPQGHRRGYFHCVFFNIRAPEGVMASSAQPLSPPVDPGTRNVDEGTVEYTIKAFIHTWLFSKISQVVRA